MYRHHDREDKFCGRSDKSIDKLCQYDFKKLRAKTIQYDEETEYIDKHWSIHSLINHT